MSSPGVRNRYATLFLLATIAFAALLLLLAWMVWPRTPQLPEYGAMPSFELIDQDGRTVRSEQLKGKVLVVNFIYTNCPDICPMLTAQMAHFQEILGTAGYLGRDVQLLSISVDPERDTPDVLKAYAELHGADTATWWFLTGPVDHVRDVVVKGFLVGMDKVPAQSGDDGHAGHSYGGASYEVSHSGRVVLVDRQGRIRAYHDGQSLEPGSLLHDVELILR